MATESFPNGSSASPCFALSSPEKQSAAGEVSDLQVAGCSLTTVPPQEPQGSESVSVAPFLLTGVHLAAPAAGSLGGRHGTEAQG